MISTTHETPGTHTRTGVKQLYCLSVCKRILSYINIFPFRNIFALSFKTCFSQSSIFYQSYYLCQQIKTVIAYKNFYKSNHNMDITSHKWGSKFYFNTSLSTHPEHSVGLRVKYPMCVPHYEIFIMLCRDNFEPKRNNLRII